MQWMSNIRMAYKIFCLVLVAAVGMGVISYTGYFYLAKSSQNMDVMVHEKMPAKEYLSNENVEVRKVQASMLEAISAKDLARRAKMKNDLEQVYAVEYNTIWQQYLAVSQNVPEAMQLVPEAEAGWKAYQKTAAEVIDLTIQGNIEQAIVLYSTVGIKNLNSLKNTLAYLKEICDNNVTEMDEQTKNDSSAANKTMLLITGIAFLLLLGAAVFIVREISHTLRSMTLACNELQQGNFREQERTLLRGDEFGEMADALVKVRTDLRNLLRNIHSSAEQLAASSEQLTASSGQAASAATQAAGAVTQAADAAVRQQEAVDTSTQAVEKVNHTVKEIETNAQQVAQNSEAAAAKAEQGNTSVDEVVGKMKAAETTVQSSAALVERLGERSQEIGQIVDTISGIAGQTNLLALNAAIEAARAGELGRGFAVVAEEVRKLAEQSQEAAQKISELIMTIQQDTAEAVDSMRQGRNGVVSGAKSVEGLRTQFAEIAGLVNGVSAEIKGIASAMQGAAADAGQITTAVQKIDHHSHTVAKEMQTVSSTTEEESASAEEIASASEALSKLAQELQNSVKIFKI